MKTKDEMQREIGRVMGLTGLSRHAMIQEIGNKNNVKVRTVYNWLDNPDPMNYGRIEGALEAIAEESKGAKA